MPTLEEVLASYIDRLAVNVAKNVVRMLREEAVIASNRESITDGIGFSPLAVRVPDTAAPAPAADGVRRPILPAATQDRPLPGSMAPTPPTAPPHPIVDPAPALDPNAPPPPLYPGTEAGDPNRRPVIPNTHP